jgi:glycosyltransferase involved in cell wall biosynthesis
VRENVAGIGAAKGETGAASVATATQALATAKILIVSPVHNEAAHIERVVRAVAAQELPPARWIVVDDGSTDQTLMILRELEPEVSFMTVLEAADTRTPAVRDRLAVAGVARNFNAGLATADWRSYSHVMKLDGDIELPPNYLRVLLERFAADSRLGLAGGVLIEPTAGGGMRPLKIPRVHVHGALKLYTRDCFEAIGGIRERLGWDTIDGAYARMHGFGTHSFPDIVSIHHRPAGGADGMLRGRARLGECAYIVCSPTYWVLARSLKVATYPPRLLSGAAFLYGYARAAARRVERVPDPAYRRFVRREARGRVARIFRVARRGES